MKRLITAIVVLLASAAPAFAQAPDIRGMWDVQFNSSQGARAATMNVLTEDGKLAAYITLAQMGEIAAWVTQKDAAVTMDATIQTQSGPLKIILNGTVSGDTMKGTVDFGGGTADWTATKQKSTGGAPQGGLGRLAREAGGNDDRDLGVRGPALGRHQHTDRHDHADR